MAETAAWIALWLLTGYALTYPIDYAAAWASQTQRERMVGAGTLSLAAVMGPVMLAVLGGFILMGLMDRLFDASLRKDARLRKDPAARRRERWLTAAGILAVFAATVVAAAFIRADAAADAPAAAEQARYDAACAPLGPGWRGHRQDDGTWICRVDQTLTTSVPAGAR